MSSLIAFSMSVLLTIYLLRLPDKSPATLMLGTALLMIPIMNVGYFLGAGFYHPLAAYHRWLTVLGSVFPAFLTPFFLYYPSRSSPRAANISMMILLLIGVFIAGYFFIDTLHSDPVYLFSGHFWNINNNRASRIFGIVPLLNSISFLLAGIWRAYTIKKKERWAVLIMAIIPFFCGFAMGVTNLMSLSGLIGREIFQNVYSITAVVGFFTLFVIYINNTRDRTDIMTRIIYISLVTLLLVLQFMSYFSFSDREVAFDRYHRQRLELLLLGQKPPSDLVYLREYDMRSDG
ncbi:MAG: hypothetical protein KDK34_11840, partial [Leptospiraceae bacterium]|nr:hypothetical protein [Leptospiraceae bacterium]